MELQIPALLTELLTAGIWPGDAKKAILSGNFSSWFSVSRFRTSGIVLHTLCGHPMKCPACDSHTTSFVDLLFQDRQIYMMPFVRMCPKCGAKIRFGALNIATLVGLLLFLHLAIEFGIIITRRHGFSRNGAVITTITICAGPVYAGLFLLWKHARYKRR